MTLLVALESVDGCGKSKHTDLLATALVAEGIAALTWRHQAPPSWFGAWDRALDFATQRAGFVRQMPVMHRAKVVICDRWLWSTHVAAHTTLRGPAVHEAMLSLVRAERFALPPVHTILLTAPVEVIAARLRARPEDVPDNLARTQGHYVALAVAHGWPVVSTDRDAAAVTADLVAIVRGLLAVPQGVCPAPTEGL